MTRKKEGKSEAFKWRTLRAQRLLFNFLQLNDVGLVVWKIRTAIEVY